MRGALGKMARNRSSIADFRHFGVRGVFALSTSDEWLVQTLLAETASKNVGHVSSAAWSAIPIDCPKLNASDLKPAAP